MCNYSSHGNAFTLSEKEFKFLIQIIYSFWARIEWFKLQEIIRILFAIDWNAECFSNESAKIENLIYTFSSPME